jgi:hypothetical protein
MRCLSTFLPEVWPVATSAIAVCSEVADAANSVGPLPIEGRHPPEFGKARTLWHFSIPAVPVTDGYDDAGSCAQEGLCRAPDVAQMRPGPGQSALAEFLGS